MRLRNGPTYVILTAAEGHYIQAAGFGDRYCVESRDVYGEGFRHWRASRLGVSGGGETKVFFRNKCPKGKHPPRGCPLTVQAGDVIDFAGMAAAILHYAATGERSERYEWRETTSEFVNVDLPITRIEPSVGR